jgi:hypothetical protein
LKHVVLKLLRVRFAAPVPFVGVSGVDQWRNTKKEVMSEILDAKFEQVSEFKKKVLKIGKNTTVVVLSGI